MRLETGKRWAIVLAGGEGERLRPFVERWFGSPRPKQYCAFAGESSMLEHTWRRALAAVDEGRLVTVVGKGHGAHLARLRVPLPPGMLVEQPDKRETCPGVYLPLTTVMAADPAGTVAVFPSDHFIAPNETFSRRLSEAFALAEALPGHIVLLAARPERCEPDYGWIHVCPPLPGWRRAHMVRRFVEKPPVEEAARMMDQGALWNTMIVVARSAALWSLGWELKPNLLARFEALRRHVGGPRQAEVLASIYEGMESSSFSRDILQKAADRTVALRLDGVAWCDWGRPERILDSLRGLGREPGLLPRTAAFGLIQPFL